MGGLIIPKTYIEEPSFPLIYLAGPIKGAPKWHDEAIEFLLSHNPDLTIASPQKEIKQNLSAHLLKGDESYFSRQRAWERHYLSLASDSGAILFWLPGEETHRCEKSYGAMTRIELGQWMTNYRDDRFLGLAIGTDGKFSEIDTIKYDLSLDAPDKKIYSTLEETCSEALRLANID